VGSIGSIRNPEKPTSPPASLPGGFFLGLRRAGLSQAPHSSSAWFHDAVPVHDATSIARHARPTAESETVPIAWPTVSSTLSQPSSISWMSPTPLAGSLIAERTKEGMNAAKRRGKHVGRPPALSGEQITFARRTLAAGDETLSGLAGVMGVDSSILRRAMAAKDRRT
jgi:hypothetical protein